MITPLHDLDTFSLQQTAFQEDLSALQAQLPETKVSHFCLPKQCLVIINDPKYPQDVEDLLEEMTGAYGIWVGSWQGGYYRAGELLEKYRANITVQETTF